MIGFNELSIVSGGFLLTNSERHGPFSLCYLLDPIDYPLRSQARTLKAKS